MQTLKEVKQSLAESYYEWWEDEDNVMTKKDLIENRINDFEYCDPQDEENIFWDAWYIRWYEVALKELKDIFDSSWLFWKEEREMWLIKLLDYLLTN